MARYFENTTIFNYTWDQVAAGYWRRYPNPSSSHVLTEDTIWRQMKNGCLHTKRLLTKTNRVPKWGERLLNAKSIKIIEESYVDPKKKILVTYTRNLGHTKVMSVQERVEYRSDGAGQTVARRSAWIDSQVFGLSRAIRAFGVDRYRKNCSQMVNGFNYVLNNLFPRHAPIAHNSEALTNTLKGVKEAAKTAKENVYATIQPNRTV